MRLLWQLLGGAVWFTEPTRQLTTACNSSLGGSDAPSWTPRAPPPTCMHAYIHNTRNFFLKPSLCSHLIRQGPLSAHKIQTHAGPGCRLKVPCPSWDTWPCTEASGLCWGQARRGSALPGVCSSRSAPCATRPRPGVPGLRAERAASWALVLCPPGMRTHTQLPCPAAAALTSATSSPCSLPQVETMVSVFCTPGVLLSSDNPWDTDCLILPEPNCGRDKERVKDAPAPCSRHCLLGNRRSCCGTLPLPRRGRARLRIHGLEVGPGQRHTFLSPRAHPSLPCTQMQPKSSHTLFFAQLLSCQMLPT